MVECPGSILSQFVCWFASIHKVYVVFEMFLCVYARARMCVCSVGASWMR